MKQSSRSKVDSFIVMDVMEQARALESSGKNIVHMEVGQPSSPALTKARSTFTILPIDEGSISI